MFYLDWNSVSKSIPTCQIRSTGKGTTKLFLSCFWVAIPLPRNTIEERPLFDRARFNKQRLDRIFTLRGFEDE